jgi:hypothetical protein
MERAAMTETATVNGQHLELDTLHEYSLREQSEFRDWCQRHSRTSWAFAQRNPASNPLPATYVLRYRPTGGIAAAIFLCEAQLPADPGARGYSCHVADLLIDCGFAGRGLEAFVFELLDTYLQTQAAGLSAEVHCFVPAAHGAAAAGFGFQPVSTDRPDVSGYLKTYCP